jgi:hypothetical protein
MADGSLRAPNYLVLAFCSDTLRKRRCNGTSRQNNEARHGDCGKCLTLHDVGNRKRDDQQEILFRVLLPSEHNGFTPHDES